MAERVAPALHALCEHLIDYAGVFPPATLSFEQACANYDAYKRGPYAWMLRRFVVDAARADAVPQGWPIAVLGDTDHPRAEAIETKTAVGTAKPTYCEVSLCELAEVKRVGSFAKLRCASATTRQIATFIRECRLLELPFKLTAGLHDPITSAHAHGFINVFLAASLAGTGRLEGILDEQDASSFQFTDQARWRDYVLTIDQIRATRMHFAHSLGSCSFEDPIRGLKALEWL